MKPNKLTRYFKDADRAGRINFIFITLAIALSIIAAVQIISSAATSGRAFNLGIFQRMENIEFSDYFHTNDMIADNSPYIADTSSYPPFVFMIARLFALFGDYTVAYTEVINQPSALMSYIVFYSLCYIGIILTTVYIMRSKGLNKGFTAAVCTMVVFNLPMLFNFERGNYIVCALLFSLSFYAFYNNESRGLREFSYIMLAFAAGIKLYPALFAVLLLREKRICDFLRCVAYSLLVILISFLTMEGGFANIAQFIHWLNDFSGDLTDYGYNYSLASTVGVVASLFGADVWELSPVVAAIQSYLPYAVLLLCAVASFLVKQKWKALALVSITIIQFPKISFTYALMFMLIPLLEFIAEQDKDRRDYAYMAFMLITIMPVYLGMAIPSLGVILNQVIISVVLTVFEYMLIAEGVTKAILSVRAYRIKNAERVLKDIE